MLIFPLWKKLVEEPRGAAESRRGTLKRCGQFLTTDSQSQRSGLDGTEQGKLAGGILQMAGSEGLAGSWK